MVIGHLKAIHVFTLELLMFELEKQALSLVCCFPPLPAAILFSCSKPFFWASCTQAARAEVCGDPLITSCLLQCETDNFGKPASHAVRQKYNLQSFVKWWHDIYVYTYVYMWLFSWKRAGKVHLGKTSQPSFKFCLAEVLTSKRAHCSTVQWWGRSSRMCFCLWLKDSKTWNRACNQVSETWLLSQ